MIPFAQSLKNNTELCFLAEDKKIPSEVKNHMLNLSLLGNGTNSFLQGYMNDPSRLERPLLINEVKDFASLKRLTD